MEYYPSEYNDYLLYFYISLHRGVISIDHIITNNFPFTKDKKEENNNKILKINKIGNEYYGTILIKENNIMSSSPMNPNKNILSIECDSGVNIDENDDFCEFNIIFYTQNDIIHLRQNEKFSFLNYDNNFNNNYYEIKLKIDVTIPLISSFLENNNNRFNYKLVIDTYSQLGSSYIDLEKDKEFFYSKDIKTFYNDNLISKEIIFDYDKNQKFQYNIIKYQFEIISEDIDFVSIIISGNNENNINTLEKRLWLNGYILTTLTKRIPQAKIIVDNLHMFYSSLNYFRTFFIFKYLNCKVKNSIIDIETNKEISNEKIFLKDSIDNISYMIISKYLSKSINKYEFDISLDKIIDDEPVCMIYFSGFLIDDLSLSSLNPVLLREDIEMPVIFLEYSFNGYNYEYLILNYNSPIIISITFEQIAEISLSYIFEKNKKSKKKEIIFQYSRNYIIPSEEIKENCLSAEDNNNAYRDKFICKLQFQIKQQPQNFKKLLLNIKVRMNNNKPVGYLNSNALTNGLILSGKFRYYYSNIRQNDSGYIVLNHKKGIGLMYARIINKNTYDYKGEKWNGRIKLLLKEEINKCKDCLINDINTNEIIFTEEHTKNCHSDLRCQIIIGVTNFEDISFDNIENNIYEYSIYLIKNNRNSHIYGNLKILSNEYIQYTLYEDDYLINKNIAIFNYFVPENVENIKYELQCKKCNLYLILNNEKILQKYNKENIIKFNSNIFQFPDNIHIQSLYNKIIQFEITYDEHNQNKYTTIFFKIVLLFKKSKESLILLNSESNTICYKECQYLLPIYDYDKLLSLTMSVSDIYLKANLKAELEFLIYDSLNYYNNITIKDYNNFQEEKIKPEKIYSNKNYIIYKTKEENKFKDMLVKAVIKILDEDGFNNYNNSYYYLIHFTFNKLSHKNYFLYPNRINLINIDKNDNYNNSLKEIKFPEYYLTNTIQNKNINLDSSLIIFNYIKGEGVVNLVTNNLYLNDDSKVYIEYKEIKTFIIDYSHSFFQINYNYKSRFSNYLGIITNENLYLYGEFYTNLYPNINEIKLGKSNYILYQYENNFPFILLLKINNISEIENNISINIKLEGLEIYQKYSWYLTGYFINSDKIEKILNIIEANPISIGYYDDILNIGIISFKSIEMIKYYKDNNNQLILLIKLIDTKIKDNKSIDIMAKVTPMNNKINNNNKYSIPPFEYYFSYINDDYISYNLSLFNKNYNYMSIELIFLSDNINYTLYTDKSYNFIDKNQFNSFNENKKNDIKIIDEKFKDGKRSLIIFFEKEIKEIYLIIYKKEEITNSKENSYLFFKYYCFSENEYNEGKYLYKNRFIINNNEINLMNKKGGIYYINWEPIKLLNLPEGKGNIKIDYFLKIIKEKNIENNGLLKIFDNKNVLYGSQLINKNEYELVNFHIYEKENIIINLVAKFNELNGMENLIIYKPYIFSGKTNRDETDSNNKDNKNIKERDKNDSSKRNNFITYYFYKFLFILFILIISLVIILYCYKEIRRYQINSIVNNLSTNNSEKLNDNYELVNEGSISNNNKDKNFNSKISYMIEHL